MHRILFSTAFLLLLCVTPAIASQDVSPAVQQFRAVSGEGFIYELTVAAAKLETMKPLPFTIDVTTSAGAPVPAAKLSCSLTMPAMAMPNNAPPVRQGRKAGQYEGVFLLTMGGLWQVELSAVYPSGQNDFVVFEIAGVLEEGKGGVNSQLEELFQEKLQTTETPKKNR